MAVFPPTAMVERVEDELDERLEADRTDFRVTGVCLDGLPRRVRVLGDVIDVLAAGVLLRDCRAPLRVRILATSRQKIEY